MDIVWLLLKGALMGISNVIPGVSGGTMAVSLGIYDDFIFSITHLLKKTKKSLKFLLPLGIGLVLGIVFFSYGIEYLLNEHAFITSFAFIGLILGGLPILNREFQETLVEKNESFSFKHGAILSLFFLVVLGSSMMQEPSANGSALSVSMGTVIMMFIVGLIAAATMIIPGVSGSLVLMILGYYSQILQLVTSFFESVVTLNWNSMTEQLMLIIPLGLGIVSGVFLVSKLVEYLFQAFPSMTYSGIIGLVLASPFAILSNINAFEDLMSSNTLPTLIIGCVLMAICSLITFKLGQVDEQVSEY